MPFEICHALPGAASKGHNSSNRCNQPDGAVVLSPAIARKFPYTGRTFGFQSSYIHAHPVQCLPVNPEACCRVDNSLVIAVFCLCPGPRLTVNNPALPSIDPFLSGKPQFVQIQIPAVRVRASCFFGG